MLLLLGKRVLDFNRGHRKFDAVRLLLEQADRDHNQTRCDVKESAQLGSHRRLALGRPYLRDPTEFLAVGTVDGQSDQRWLYLCSGRLGLLGQSWQSCKSYGKHSCDQT